MSSGVGRCLWDGLGQTQCARYRGDDQRAAATDLLWRAESLDARVSPPGGHVGGWETHGGLYSVVSKPVSGQEVVILVGWGELSPRCRDAGVSRVSECGIGGEGLASDLSLVCP